MRPPTIQLTNDTEIPRDGEIVSVGIPFVSGELAADQQLSFSANDHSFPAQQRVLTTWPDGSVKWLLVTVPGTVGANKTVRAELKENDAGRYAGPGVQVDDETDAVRVDTGVVVFTISKSQFSLLQQVEVGGQKFLRSKGCPGVVLWDERGTFYHSCADTDPEIEIIESGPYRAMIRQQGKLINNKWPEPALSLDVRMSFDLNSSAVRVILTYTADNEHHVTYLRDLRWLLPHRLEEGRTVDMRDRYPTIHQGPAETKAPPEAMPRFEMGCGFGDRYWDHIDPDNEYYLLQEAADYHNIYQVEPGLGTYPVASGGARGDRAPGWVEVRSACGVIRAWIRDFWQSYPKEIAITAEQLSLAIWPERAISAIAARRQMPEPPEADRRWQEVGYECIIPHSYFTGYSPGRDAYELVQGMGRTHEFVVQFSDSEDDCDPERWYRRASTPLLAVPDPDTIHTSGVMGAWIGRQRGDLQSYEEMLERGYDWWQRQAQLYNAYSELDWGDRQRHYHTVRMGKSAKGEVRHKANGGFFGRCHPRAGWWNNNERDTHRAFYVQYLRSSRRDYLDTFMASARHNMEVDLIRRASGHGSLGLVGHEEGHCYKTRWGGDIDHNWLTGFLDYYHLTGDPRARETAELVAELLTERVMQLGDKLSTMHPRASFRPCWELSNFYLETYDERYLQAAELGAQALLARQEPDGSYGEDCYSHGGSQMALLRYYLATEKPQVLDSLVKSVEYSVGDFSRIDDLKLHPDLAGQDPSNDKASHKRSLRIIRGDMVGTPKTGELLAWLYSITGDEQNLSWGRALLQVCLTMQDQSGHPPLDGTWPEVHRMLPYRNGNMLQHLPILIAAIARGDR